MTAPLALFIIADLLMHLESLGFAGALLIAAALINAARLSRWTGFATWAEKLLFILHVGYSWLVLGVLLLGLSVFDIGVPVASAIHALTAGATAVMILAVMPRVTLGQYDADARSQDHALRRNKIADRL